jgi:hypothetical protein
VVSCQVNRNLEASIPSLCNKRRGELPEHAVLYPNGTGCIARCVWLGSAETVDVMATFAVDCLVGSALAQPSIEDAFEDFARRGDKRQIESVCYDGNGGVKGRACLPPAGVPTHGPWCLLVGK